MKKNAIGHMMAAKEPVTTKIRNWDILPRLVCLLLAFLLWLVVVNVNKTDGAAQEAETDTAFTTSES